MFIYNVTTKVEASCQPEWLQWMIDEHLPAIQKTGCFERSQLAKLLDVDESEGVTFVAQYYAVSKADYNRYIELHAPALRKEMNDKWANRFVAFRTLMEVVH